jgi:hypothetical protein
MSRKKLQEKKKKQRKEIAKKRVLARREDIRAEAKKMKAQEIAIKKATKSIPIKGSLADRDAEIQEKLRHNYAILEALDAEYNREQEQKKKLNEQLEAEGHFTLKEKMDAMSDSIGAPKLENDDVEYIEVDEK